MTQSAVLSDAGLKYAKPLSLTALFLIAIIVTLTGSLTSYFGLGMVPSSGVDDANITQIYGRNLAQGFGYVFNQGGERVEGSTSFLWTLINALAYLSHTRPILILTLICALLTTGSVFTGLLLARFMAHKFEMESRWPVLATAFVTACTPSFFGWMVWALMDVSLWGFGCLLLTWLCVRLADGNAPGRGGASGLCALTGGLVITRPEGIAFAAALLIATAGAGYFGRLGRENGRKKVLRAIFLALAIAVLAMLGLTLFRVFYFGYPFPNTYYAKISSDKLAAIKQGAAYFAKGCEKLPLLPAGLAIWGGWFIVKSGLIKKVKTDRTSAQFAYFIPVLTSLAAIIAMTIGVGGDHFYDQRFFQPLVPILAAGTGVTLAHVADKYLVNYRSPSLVQAALALFIFVTGVSVAALSYKVNPKNMKVEFDIANQGRRYGQALNMIEDRNGPLTAGVIAAGGLPFAFHGKSYDLEGLNWVAMAHADPLKAGVQAHASFDPALFFKTGPDFVIIEYREYKKNVPWIIPEFYLNALKGILIEPVFRQRYTPILIEVDGSMLGSFASNAWLAKSKDVGITRVSWDNIFFINEGLEVDRTF